MEIGAYNATRTWIKNNPEYSYHFFNNEKIREYIKNNFEDRVLKAFDSLVPGAYKADLWRYCILYKEGGVYADAKQVNLVPLRKIIDPQMDFISVKDRPKNAIYNAFICAVPGHPFMKKAIDLSVDNILNKRYNSSNLDITGPETLGKAVLLLTNSEKELNQGVFDSKYGKYELLDAKLDDHIILKNGIPAIKSRHVGFTNWSKISGVPHYETLWRRRKVYKDNEASNPFPSVLDTNRPSFSFVDPIS
jgi:mannosyltransferase OCH1-like enzyme